MNKDYVRTTSRPPRKRKPTGRSGSGAQPTRAPFPVVRAVLAVALVIGFGVFLYLLKGHSSTPADTAKPKAMTKPIPIEEQRPGKEKFDYMTLLENKEVNVDLPSGATPTDLSIDPEQQKRILAQQAAIEQQRLKAQQLSDLANPTAATTPAGTSTTATGTSTTNEAAGTPTKPKLSESERAAALLAGQIVPFSSLEDSKPAKPKTATASTTATSTTSSTPNRGYLMQCGAFRGAEQAESMKLRLSMQGSGAQVQRGSTASGTWYKVLLGPFASRAEAERQLAHLQSKRIVEHCTIWMK